MKGRYLILVIIGLMTAGCTATNYQPAINHLQMKVGQLEANLKQKNQQIDDLQYEVDRLTSLMNKQQEKVKQEEEQMEGVRKVRNTGVVRINVTETQVQNALKSSGYYEGNVDGKVGENTKKSIIAFQKDHGLTADGIVGVKTWMQLRNYIE